MQHRMFGMEKWRKINFNKLYISLVITLKLFSLAFHSKILFCSNYICKSPSNLVFNFHTARPSQATTFPTLYLKTNKPTTTLTGKKSMVWWCSSLSETCINIYNFNMTMVSRGWWRRKNFRKLFTSNINYEGNYLLICTITQYRIIKLSCNICTFYFIEITH